MFKNSDLGLGEVVQRLAALDALADVLSLVLTIQSGSQVTVNPVPGDLIVATGLCRLVYLHT